MRLLEILPNGDFRLTRKLLDNAIPPYAILSHTWEDESQEVTFEDMVEASGRGKAGFEKIRFCGEQATRDGLRYFWVDTCCIKKSSDAELSESLISMFRWYQGAEKCYVYLSDVSTRKRKRRDDITQDTWEQAFQESRWFTRGWTLQELLAPSSVEFFTPEGKRLGDKQSLKQQIQTITGIPISALRPSALSQFSIDQKLDWAKKRQTTREEDWAYSLLGIFGISMSVLYGEGRANAITRLMKKIEDASKYKEINLTEQDRQIDKLPYADDAAFNSQLWEQKPRCLPNTRVQLLRLVEAWSEDPQSVCIFWLRGMAGTGKSTIARTVAGNFANQKQLGGSFFFSRGQGDLGHGRKLFTTLATQLASKVPSLRCHISRAISENPLIIREGLGEQWKRLIFQPLSHLEASQSSTQMFFIVIDALDECEGEDDIRQILGLLSESRGLKRVKLRVFITSRPETQIRFCFRKIPEDTHQDFALHDVDSVVTGHDISLFLSHELEDIRKEYSIQQGWPDIHTIQLLSQRANGLFIYAATTCRFLRSSKCLSPEDSLRLLLQGSITSKSPDGMLDKIYMQVLEHSVIGDSDGQEGEELAERFREIVGAIVILFDTVSAGSLPKLIDSPERVVQAVLGNLHSILDIPEYHEHAVQLLHPSFRDFLLDLNRCSDVRFRVDERSMHRFIFLRCIRLISRHLKQDICQLGLPGSLAVDLDKRDVDKYIPPYIQYACRYWVDHVTRSNIMKEDWNEILLFFQKDFLYWLEALGLMGNISNGVTMVTNLEALLTPESNKTELLLNMIQDAKRFILYNRSIIEKAPLQVYVSALVFAPKKSLIRNQFSNLYPSWITTGPDMEENWSPCLQTLEGHTDAVCSVAFSYDGQRLASGSADCTVRLWDSETGTLQQALEGHIDLVNSVTFSRDNQWLASGSYDATVRIWDGKTGTLQQTLKGHTSRVFSVDFSPDSRRLASASLDCTIRLWDIKTGTLQLMLKGYISRLRSVAFSPDGRRLVTVSDSPGMGRRDDEARTVQQIHKDHISSIICLPDGQQMTSGSENDKVQLWNSETGTLQQTFGNHAVQCVAFSPDGRRVAVGSLRNGIELWDSETGILEQTFTGSGIVNSIAFSPNGQRLVSGSIQNGIELWDSETGALQQTFEGPSDMIYSLAFSHDNQRFISASRDHTVRLWDIKMSTLQRTLKNHFNKVHFTIIRPTWPFRLYHNQILWLWNDETGALQRAIENYISGVRFMTFSHDGRQLVSVFNNHRMWLWNSKTGALQQKFYPYNVCSVAFSHDDRRLASASTDCTVQLWDFETGTPQQTFKGHTNEVRCVVFSADDRRLASGSADHTVRLWNSETGALQQVLEAHSDIHSVAFSPNGRWLASSSRDQLVRLWDTETGVLLQTLKIGSSLHQLSFGPDGLHLITERGVISLHHSPSDVIQTPTWSGYGVRADNSWITANGTDILWIPPEYRPTLCTVQKQTVAIRCSSDQVLVMKFDPKLPLV